MSSEHPKRVVLVEDEPCVSSMLSRWLKESLGWQTVGIAGNGADGYELCRQQQPDLAVVDLEMPGTDGLTLAEQLVKSHPKIRVVIFTSHLDPFCVHRIKKLGRCNYVAKGTPLPELEQAFRRIDRGEIHFDDRLHPSVQRLQEPAAYFKLLSERELEIIQCVCQGISDQDMSDRLGISVQTVITHRRNIRRKIGAHDDRQIVKYAKEWGIDALPTQGAPTPPRPTQMIG